MRRAVQRLVTWMSAGLILAAFSPATATELNFDVYLDPLKLLLRLNNELVPQSYGDNVSNFDPAGASAEGVYYRYGSGGGLTPHVSVEYRYLHVTDPTNTGSFFNGIPSGRIWDNDYGNLHNVLFNNNGNSQWFEEIRLIPEEGYRVTLNSFDIAGWSQMDIGGQTLKIVQDANLPTATVLWSAGPDFGVTIHGAGPTHDSFAPAVGVDAGHSLSLIYGLSSNIGVDNVNFSESAIEPAVPEPSTLAMVGIGAGWWLHGLRRRSRTGYRHKARAVRSTCAGPGQGFTVIELLVVTAILAVLAAMLLPSLQSARETTKRATCMANMRQVAVALHLLANDNNGWLNGINAPLSATGDASTGVWRWTAAIAPYLGNPGNTNWYYSEHKMLSWTEDTTFCPGRKGARPDSTSPTGFSEGEWPYGANTLFVGYQHWPMHSLREVVHPARIYLLSDCFNPWPESINNLSFQSIWTIDGAWGSGHWFSPRHPAKPRSAPGDRRIGNGLNFVFVDGHGEFLKRYGTNWNEVDWYKTWGQATRWEHTGGYGISGE